ncbi:hypothetical protein ACFRR7_14860 [Streptomyces sp. NPDC056909]|uniref:hypothetical protein n=1 Tax=Streptomyces sp. NPDC056909 TaxID=3345963 RepID=UPI003687C12C
MRHQERNVTRDLTRNVARYGERKEIVVFVYDGVRLMDVAAPLEVFGTAAGLGGAYSTAVCSADGGPVITSTGTRLSADTAGDRPDRCAAGDRPRRLTGARRVTGPGG